MQTIIDLFERIVRSYPDNLAVKVVDRVFTYAELNSAANRVAHAILHRRGLGSEPIGLIFENGIDGIAALLGVSKAGKYYFAVDNAHPLERNRYMIENSGAALVLTNSSNYSVALDVCAGLAPVLRVDEVVGAGECEDPRISISLEDFFAVAYTSGSTGLPKGVSEQHGSRLHDTLLHVGMANVVAADRLSLLHSAGLVGAEVQLFRALCSGAALLPFDLRSEGAARLAEWLCQEAISVLHTTPAVFRELSDHVATKDMLAELRILQLSGAPIAERDIQSFRGRFSSKTRLQVHMGSTETGPICSALIEQDFAYPRRGAPVGYPLAGKEIILFDDNGDEVVSGEVGEIAVRSRYLAAGYWKDPELTAAKFLPGGGGAEVKTYLTGDLGEILPDGFLIHLGRKDLMVNIRGNRVELGEIENALLAQPDVKDAAVAAWISEDGREFLAAYVVPRDRSWSLDEALRGFLSARLPNYMLPSHFVFLESLPLVNGKLDRKALPKPARKLRVLNARDSRPRSEIEITLLEIWQEVLDVRPIGIHDNFFALGGDSLIATRVISRVFKYFQFDVPLKALFRCPTVAEMAAVILQKQGTRLDDGQLQIIMDGLESMSEAEAERFVRESCLSDDKV